MRWNRPVIIGAGLIIAGLALTGCATTETTVVVSSGIETTMAVDVR